MLYGALEEVLTGWVLGQLPDDADGIAAAEREVIATIVGGLRAAAEAPPAPCTRPAKAEDRSGGAPAGRAEPPPARLAPRCAALWDSRRVLDPQKRWRPLPDKPDYAGFLSFGGAPLAQEPERPRRRRRRDRRCADRRSRLGPAGNALRAARDPRRVVPARAAPRGGHRRVRRAARSSTTATRRSCPADPERSHAAIARLVGEVVDAGALPITLGGDHSITEPCVTAVAERRGPVGLVHFDTHTDTGREVFGVERSHGTPMFRLVEAGTRRRERATRRSACAATGPGRPSSSGSASTGIASFFMHDVRDLGIREVVERALAHVGGGPRLPDGRRRRARPGVRAGNRNAGARRDDVGRPAVGGARDRDARRARRRRRRRGAADGGRLGRHHRARRRPHRPRAAHRSRAASVCDGA